MDKQEFGKQIEALRKECRVSTLELKVENIELIRCQKKNSNLVSITQETTGSNF